MIRRVICMENLKFNDLSASERKEFDKILRKNSEKSEVEDNKVQLWPEDDEDLLKSYFRR